MASTMPSLLASTSSSLAPWSPTNNPATPKFPTSPFAVQPSIATTLAGNPALSGNLINDLMSNITNAVTQYGQSQADSLTATGRMAEAKGYTQEAAGYDAQSLGFEQEAGSYDTAAAIARSNQRLAGASGDIEQAQIGLQVSKTIGSQQASVAAAGFGSGGTALSLMRSSNRQGTIEKQLAGTNSEMQQLGFAQQAQAADTEAIGARTSATGATTMADYARSSADAATASAESSTALANTSSTVANALKTNATSMASSLALNIPDLANLSATQMPSVNAVDLMNQLQNPQTTMLGGRQVSAANPFII